MWIPRTNGTTNCVNADHYHILRVFFRNLSRSTRFNTVSARQIQIVSFYVKVIKIAHHFTSCNFWEFVKPHAYFNHRITIGEFKHNVQRVIGDTKWQIGQNIIKTFINSRFVVTINWMFVCLQFGDNLF